MSDTVILGLLGPRPAFETGWATHPGLLRRSNEDGYVACPEHGVWAVADGMGGHEDGALASAIVVEALGSIGAPASAADLLSRLEDRILRANAAIRRHAAERGRMVGSTVVALLIFGGHFACLWSGDSRLYRIQGGRIDQVSRDHSEAQELVDSGLLTAEEAERWPRRNVVTRALGVQDDPVLDMEHGPVAPGDVFVLCSDGLTAHVAAPEILSVVRDREAQDACGRLVELALAGGGTDNVTVLVIRCLPRPPEPVA